MKDDSPRSAALHMLEVCREYDLSGSIKMMHFSVADTWGSLLYTLRTRRGIMLISILSGFAYDIQKQVPIQNHPES